MLQQETKKYLALKQVKLFTITTNASAKSSLTGQTEKLFNSTPLSIPLAERRIFSFPTLLFSCTKIPPC